MTSSSRLLSRAATVACVLATVVLSTELVDSQGRRNGRRTATEIVDGHEVAAGEILVRFRDAAASALRQPDLELEGDVDEVETVDRRGLRRMRSRSRGTRALMQIATAYPDVEIAEPNYLLRHTAIPNDPSFGSLWGLFNSGQSIGGTTGIAGVDIGGPAAWDITKGSRSFVIGVIDSGIDYNHSDLQANMWQAPSSFTVVVGGVSVTCPAGSRGFNGINNTCNPMDDHGHGTHVAGTIGATGNNGVGVVGVNWIASMMGLKFLDSSGSGWTSDAIKTIDFAVQAKAAFAGSNGANVRILNNSWGGGGYSQLLKDAIDRSNSAGMLFVAAAGNDSRNNDSFPQYPANYTSSNVVSVAATDNRDRRASFSNYGANTVHLGAPGVSVLSTIPNNAYSFFNGTSMASPHVAGAAGLVLAHCPSTTTAQLKQILLSTGDPVSALSGLTTTGRRLNVRAALGACSPRVTNVTLSANRTSPQALGTTITWTASPTGGSSPYQYKWWLHNGTSWAVARDWGTSNAFDWTPSTSGIHTVGVWVRSSGNGADAAEFPASSSYAISAPVVTSVALTPNVTSPQLAGTTVTWTASAAGGVTPYRYKFWLLRNGTWSVARDWSSSNTFAWTPPAGSYSVGVWVKSDGNPADTSEMPAAVPFTINAAPRVGSATLAPNMSSPRATGTTIRWTATPTGGTAPHQYKFWVSNGAVWTMVRDWSTTNTFDWTPASGTYSVGVWVKSAGNPADAAEVTAAAPYVINAAPRVGSVSLTANRASPQGVGTTIRWTADPSGGTAPYQYKFWVSNGSAWTMVRDWSTSNTYDWTPVPGNYLVGVWVRSAGNNADAPEVPVSVPFSITQARVTSVSLTPNMSSPRPPGATITFTASPTGGTGPYSYRWWVMVNGVWTPIGGWTASNTFAWTAPSVGTYQIGVWVKSAGNGADAPETPASIGYVIQ